MWLAFAAIPVIGNVIHLKLTHKRKPYCTFFTLIFLYIEFSAKSIDRSNFQIFKFSVKNQIIVKKNSSAWFSYFTEIRTVDFFKRCFKNVSVSYHWIMSPQQRCSWINRLRSQFYLRKRSRFNFLRSFSCKRFLLSSINLF